MTGKLVIVANTHCNVMMECILHTLGKYNISLHEVEIIHPGEAVSINSMLEEHVEVVIPILNYLKDEMPDMVCHDPLLTNTTYSWHPTWRNPFTKVTLTQTSKHFFYGSTLVK